MGMSGDPVFWACTALLMLSSCGLAQSLNGTETPANATTVVTSTIATVTNATTKASTAGAPNTTAAPVVTTASNTSKTSPAPKPASTTATVPVPPSTNASTTTVISKTTVTTVTSTATIPVTSTESSAPQKISGFDLGSFIGGIVLTLGILAVLYFGCKFYTSKRGVRYRTIDEHEAII